MVQAWIPEDLLEKALKLSKGSLTETILLSIETYVKSGKSEKELAQERLNAALLEAAEAKAELDEINKRESNNLAKEKEEPIKIHKTPISKNLSEKECNDIWEQKMWPHIKKKISEHGIEKVVNDEHLLSNFSKSLGVTNDELKEKICITAGVV
ncbi:MAG: hypothetical protein APG12_01735 [Candidatus Methanofastidiosum methylothiophilum]|uniref:Uncharacterized protein n=1 Tax=Candidatus Methanofastidiosum methylothiophilum TaxID=1705564 RepID=A0A150IPJ2_9EURY|nr:MAG: hypothetical protein APG10_01828 [Candidatus Methanofastidiosum methylthiophilus]KYC46870.1 MAG: hypothetical protein APG11_01629 [Candidatus Methanofastidiosum methylthiophilus]KYC48963.1 MAG: hypothetical protein APG12_01735 [Candidatus Methanofastidiosum methylthiophilus]